MIAHAVAFIYGLAILGSAGFVGWIAVDAQADREIITPLHHVFWVLCFMLFAMGLLFIFASLGALWAG